MVAIKNGAIPSISYDHTIDNQTLYMEVSKHISLHGPYDTLRIMRKVQRDHKQLTKLELAYNKAQFLYHRKLTELGMPR